MKRASDTSEDSNSSQRVSFSTVEFHEHANVLGCSPSTTNGPPIEIGWQQIDHLSISLDDYEEQRPPRRIKEELVMPGVIREEVLLESGYTRSQIFHHLKKMKEEKRLAERSKFSTMPIMMLGRARRKFSNILTSQKS